MLILAGLILKDAIIVAPIVKNGAMNTVKGIAINGGCMNKSLIILVLILGCVSSSIFADESTLISSEGNKPTEKEILDDFQALNREKRDERFSDFENRLKNDYNSPIGLAKLYIIYGRFDEHKEYTDKAIEILNEYVKSNPASSSAYLELGNAYSAKLGIGYYFKRWEKPEEAKLRNEALKYVEKALELNPKNVEAHIALAELQESRESEIEHLKKAVEIDPSSSVAWGSLATTQQYTKRYDEAVRTYLKWLNTSPDQEDQIEIYSGLGDVFSEKHEYDSAVDWYQKAIALRSTVGDPSSEDGFTLLSSTPQLLQRLANIYWKQGSVEQAESFFKKALNIQPDDAEIRFDLARLYFDNKNYQQAIVEGEQVLAYSKDHTSALYNLALAYKENKDEEKSKELFLKYLNLQIDKEDEHSKKWVENAKSQLRDMYVYDFPKSKKESRENKTSSLKTWSVSIFAVAVIFGVGILARKFRKISRAIVLAGMALIITIICFAEMSSYEPKLSKALLCFIPVFVFGGLFLYFLRDKQPEKIASKNNG